MHVTFTGIDFTSSSWLMVREWAQVRIDVLRGQLEGDLAPEETARVRGQIRAFKELIGLPERVARERGLAPGQYGFAASDTPIGV